MNDVSELFWNATVEEIKHGYIYDDAAEEYICLVCGTRFMKGVIYSEEDVFYEAGKFAKLHLARAHTSMFDYLLSLDKKLTGLTEHQKMLINYFYQGRSDAEIVKELDGGSTSTIRNHRFTLREKAKQAKVFLAIMDLAEAKTGKQEKFISVHRTATMLDERYAITEQENEEIIAKYFENEGGGKLLEFPKKEKRKIAILKHVMKRFEPNKKYTEKEVNSVLKAVYDDYVTLRRYLIDYGFMERTSGGSAYWVKV
ncbi:DUF2087 domain-containing protein [Aneurinibacillus tyrosinisolvens]|uniref:DUF2087 domain-containing protein n=1 Tax=Aneurinibacillus tyrosinisolvens TaxID=1443435 RepID=UPI00063EFB38|nr:DUF2087 domain-containing protein [Aneurinibacillus tyrosinisolvens]